MHHIHKNNRYIKYRKITNYIYFLVLDFSKLILPSSSYFLDCTDTVRVVVKVVTIIINVVQNFAYIINVVFFSYQSNDLVVVSR